MLFWASLKLMRDKCKVSGFFKISSLVVLNKLCSVSVYDNSGIQIHVPIGQEKCWNLSVMYILYLILLCPSVSPYPLIIHWKLHLPPKNTSSVYLCSSFFMSSTSLHAAFICSTFSCVHIFPSTLFLLNMVLHLPHTFLTSILPAI